MRNLTVSVVSLSGADLEGVRVEAVLQGDEGGDDIITTNPGRKAPDWQRPVTALTDADGFATLVLIPSTQLPAGYTYQVAIYGRQGTFVASGLLMPDEDTTLADLIDDQDPPPAPALAPRVNGWLFFPPDPNDLSRPDTTLVPWVGLGWINTTNYAMRVWNGTEWHATSQSAPPSLTGQEIVALLSALSGNARLPASAVRDLPDSSAVAVQDEGTEITAAARVLNFVGASIQATVQGDVVTIQVGSGGGVPVTPVTPTIRPRYCALRASGAAAADFTEADFQGGNSSNTNHISSPSSNDDMVVGFAVPQALGRLAGVSEVGNPLAAMIRGAWNPQVGSTDVELTVNGQACYIYASIAPINAALLPKMYALTQG